MHLCISHIVRNRPRWLLGQGFSNPFHTQGLRRLLTIIEQLWHDAPSGYLLRTNIEALVVELRTFGLIFDSDTATASKWVNTSHAWLVAALKYRHAHRIVLSLSFRWLQPIRTNDEKASCQHFTIMGVRSQSC